MSWHIDKIEHEPKHRARSDLLSGVVQMIQRFFLFDASFFLTYFGMSLTQTMLL